MHIPWSGPAWAKTVLEYGIEYQSVININIRLRYINLNSLRERDRQAKAFLIRSLQSTFVTVTYYDLERSDESIR